MLINFLVVCIALLHAANVIILPGGERFENLLYDLRVKLTLPGGVDERIVIVDIDEHSLREEGHWPWSRSKLAALTDQLFDKYEIATLGFDVVFAEKEENREIDALREVARKRGRTSFIAELDDMAAGLDRDLRFAQALVDRPITLGYYFNINPERTENSGMLPAPLSFDDSVKNALVPPRGCSYGANIKPLQSSVASAGFFSNPLLGPDGIVRRVPTVHESEGC
ncbi:MAG: CHASE2 domain-containing protein [Arenicellales bacterium]